MKKNVWTFGLIAGLVNACWIIAFGLMGPEKNFDNGEIYGYSAMILSFSLVFVAMKNFRDKFNHGELTFGKGFMIGLYITLIGSTCYVVTWLIEYYFFIPDFGDKYTEYYINSLKASGAAKEEVEKKIIEMAQFKELYKNPFFNAALTYVEILPVGLLISLISAAILRRKPGANAQVAVAH